MGHQYQTLKFSSIGTTPIFKRIYLFRVLSFLVFLYSHFNIFMLATLIL